MDLRWVKLTDFRRFRNTNTLNVSGRLVAIVGPNEAGKTSILNAISLLGNDKPINRFNLPRGSNKENLDLEAKFYLSKKDLIELKLNKSASLIVKKKLNGTRSFKLIPDPPKRNIDLRKRVKQDLDKLIGNQTLSKRINSDDPKFYSLLQDTSSKLSSENENLHQSVLTQIENCSKSLNSFISLRAFKSKYVQNLPTNLIQLKAVESELSPSQFANNKIKSLIPNILEFTEPQRDLKGEYNLKEVIKAGPPVALKNLVEIAELELKALDEAVINGDTAQSSNILKKANKKLKKAFKNTWSQSSIRVHFKLDGIRFIIHIIDKGEHTTLTERSEGLKIFVALQAFTTINRSEKPILLIDEAEIHLHYDGQADLVQMLTKQNVTSKIIYTTHSAGCLPEDLGNGIRLAITNKNDLTSSIKNKFWSTVEKGFSPLLFNMGATTMAFFPVRKALVVEGPVDMLLYPILFRQAKKSEYLGFQIVPGLSETSLQRLPIPEIKGNHVVYLVDGDPGGMKLKKDLIKLGVSQKIIYSLPYEINKTTTVVEDLIDLDMFLLAMNKVMEEYYPNKTTPTKIDFPGIKNRDVELNNYLKKNNIKNFSKIEVAYELLNIITEDPEAVILSKNYSVIIESLFEDICAPLSKKN